MKIVGISGKAESGKDTAAGFIVKVFQRPRRTSFADALKVEALKLWVAPGGGGEQHPYRLFIQGESILSEDQLLALANDLKASPAFRTFLQDHGHKRRQEHEDYWIVAAYDRHSRLHGHRPMVIADVRYKNEADWVRNAGGILLRVERHNHQNSLTAEQRSHPSETDLDDYEHFNGFLNNEGNPVEFLAEVLRETRPYLLMPRRA